MSLEFHLLLERIIVPLAVLPLTFQSLGSGKFIDMGLFHMILQSTSAVESGATSKTRDVVKNPHASMLLICVPLGGTMLAGTFGDTLLEATLLGSLLLEATLLGDLLVGGMRRMSTLFMGTLHLCMQLQRMLILGFETMVVNSIAGWNRGVTGLARIDPLASGSIVIVEGGPTGRIRLC